MFKRNVNKPDVSKRLIASCCLNNSSNLFVSLFEFVSTFTTAAISLCEFLALLRVLCRLHAALELKPDDWMTLLRRSELFGKTGRRQQALDDYKLAVDIQSNTKLIQYIT
jgi:hypothetical protein